MNMDERDYKLIMLVQQHQHIYDKNSYYFKDKNAVETSWKLIAASLNTSEDDCQRRWCVLRNRYAKHKREEGKPENRGKKPWPLIETMSFLESHVKRRRSFRTVSDIHGFGIGTEHILPDNPIFTKPEKWEEIIIDEDDDSNMEDIKHFHSDSNASSEDNPARQLPKCIEVQSIPRIVSTTTVESSLKDIEIIRLQQEKKPENFPNGVEEKKPSVVEDKSSLQINGLGPSNQVNITTPDDSLLHFCLSLHQSMKTLPKKYLTKAKIEILQVIDKYENDN